MDCFRKQKFVINTLISVDPLPSALTEFTDGSKTKSAYWTKDKFWVQKSSFGSVQQNELLAVINVLQDFTYDVNIIADSAYVVGLVQNTATAVISTSKPIFNMLFSHIKGLLLLQNSRRFITHIKSILPGPLTFGHHMVDQLVVFATPEEEHNHNHAIAGYLHIKYKISYFQVKQMIANCPICKPLHIRCILSGTNPRGMQPNELWQMDVTHISQFGCLSYIHVSIDTFSKFVWGTPLPGECTAHVI